MRLTIRMKLAVLVLAVLLPLLAAAALKFWSDLSEGRRLAHQNQLDTARLVAGQIDEVLSSQIESLLALASLHTLDRIQDSDLEALAVRVRAQHPFLHRFVAAGVDGRVLAASGPRVPEATFIPRDVLDAVLRRGEPEVTAPQQSLTDRRQVVPIMVPVRDRQGRIVGVIGAEMDLETLSFYLSALPLSRGQAVAVVAPGGAVLARSASPEKFFDRHLGGVPEAGLLLRQRGGTAEWASPGGVPHLAGAAGTDRAAWVVMAAVPSGAAFSPAIGRFKRDLVGLGAATMVALLVAWLIGNRMHRFRARAHPRHPRPRVGARAAHHGVHGRRAGGARRAIQPRLECAAAGPDRARRAPAAPSRAGRRQRGALAAPRSRAAPEADYAGPRPADRRSQRRLLGVGRCPRPAGPPRLVVRSVHLRRRSADGADARRGRHGLGRQPPAGALRRGRHARPAHPVPAVGGRARALLLRRRPGRVGRRSPRRAGPQPAPRGPAGRG